MILVSIYLIARLEVPKEREMPKPLDKEKGRKLLCFRPEVSWSRGADLNHRPSGYEPDELTRLLHPAMYVKRLFTMGKAARKNITLAGRTKQELNLTSQNHHM